MTTFTVIAVDILGDFKASIQSDDDSFEIYCEAPDCEDWEECARAVYDDRYGRIRVAKEVAFTDYRY